MPTLQDESCSFTRLVQATLEAKERNMPANKARALPRPFNYHWGSGQIVEEASYSAEHHEPAIQLLQYEGEHDGTWSIRFCYYNPRGMFQRSPLVMGEDELKGLRVALKKTPKLRRLLKRLVD
jgi:hypothetical protein